MIYFEWAKEMVIRAKQLTESQFTDQLNDIEHQMQNCGLAGEIGFCGGDIHHRTRGEIDPSGI